MPLTFLEGLGPPRTAVITEPVVHRLACGAQVLRPDAVDAPLYRGQVRPFVALAEEVGAPWKPFLEAAGVAPDPYDPAFEITARQLYRFVHELSRRELGPDTSLMAMRKKGFVVLPPQLRQALFQAPTLLRALCAARQHVSLVGPTLQLWLHLTPTHLLVGHLSAARGEALGTVQAEICRTVCLASLVQAFVGEDWRPPVVGVTAPSPFPRGFEAWMEGGQIVYGRPCGVIALPIELFWRNELMRGEVTARDPDAVRASSQARRSTRLDLLEAVLPSMLLRGPITLDSAAECAGMSGRSLQRRLAARGTSFRRLLERVRLEEGWRLLRDSELSVQDIARRLGYEEHTNFSRAFRRMHGLSPTQVRYLGGPSLIH